MLKDSGKQVEAHNLAVLFAELAWLDRVINRVIRGYLKQEGHDGHWTSLPMPDIAEDHSTYAQCVRIWGLDHSARIAVGLAMAPHLKPEMLDIFFGLNQAHERAFTEFGGTTDDRFSGFLPTAQTLNFLLSSHDPGWRGQVMDLLDADNILMAEQVLTIVPADNALPQWSGMLGLSDQWLHYFVTGEKLRPEMSAAFPAQPIDTPLDWQDLVLDEIVMEQIEEIRTWLVHGNTLMTGWNLQKKIKPGFRALFYGPPGTGKTLTASLLAKSTGREIYRVDLSMVVSKYIGETEKNLSRIFDVASYKNWILFFDEADALFGERTVATSSNDRHANQQTGYLLQRIEDFPGVVILASNLRANIDEAFTRRFQSMIHFTVPAENERLQLWRNAFSGSCDIGADIDFCKIAQDYEMTGGAIINVLRHAAMSAIRRNSREVNRSELIAGIRREFMKDNKTIREIA